jgi:KUP system potassium uptake protein
MRANPPFRLPGTAAVLGRKASGVPLALTQNLKHNHVLHTNIFFVTAMTTETPRVPEEERVEVNRVGEGVWRVILRYGFMEKPDVPQGIALAMSKGLVPKEEIDKVTYYVGHETIIAKGLTGEMSSWREAIFAFMHRNAQRAGVSFNIPSAQIVEIGVEFEM